MDDTPRVPLLRLFTEACTLVADPDVSHPIADDAFARIYGLLLAVLQRTRRARTTRPELERRRARQHQQLQEMCIRLVDTLRDRCQRRWPTGPDGQPDFAVKRELVDLLHNTAPDALIQGVPGPFPLEPLGRAIGAAVRMLAFWDTAEHSPRILELLPAARLNLANDLAKLEQAWCRANERALFGGPQDVDSDESLELLLSLGLDDLESRPDPSAAPK